MTDATGPAPAAPTYAPDPVGEALRLTWAQPEDLVGHELRQAAEDGRNPAAALRAWLAAGGHPAPDRAGASPTPVPPELRALASRLLDDLAQLPARSAPDEPGSWPDIRATWPPAAKASQPPVELPTPAPRPDPDVTARPGAAGAPPVGQEHVRPTIPGAAPNGTAGTRPDRDPEHPAARPPARPDGRTREPHPGSRKAAPPAGPAAGGGVRGTAPDPGPPPAGPAPAPSPAAERPWPAGRDYGHVRSHPEQAPTSTGPVPGRVPHRAAGTPPAGREHVRPSALGAAPPRAAGQPGAGPGAVPQTGPEATPQTGPEATLRARLEAAWLGRAVGCLLGKPVEKLPLEGIRALARAAGNWPLDDWFSERGVLPEVLAAYPWNRRSAPTSLAENIDGMPEDDDLNYPLLGLLLLQRHGKGFTTADVARLWLDELPAGRTFTAERIAYRNLLLGLEPPVTATHHNPFREWIGALIRADVHGWTNPGDPAAAAAQAYRDATLTHTGNGVYAALFVAAATATAATGRSDVHTALRTGLAFVPPRSRLAEAVRFGIRAAGQEADFDLVVDRLHAHYGHYHWVHAVPNTALIAAALTHADGDFSRSVCRAVSGGWDTDSNGATAGALAGLLAGSPDALPHRWTAPLKNRLATTVPGFDGIGFDTLAHLTAQEAARS
ncbi:ADP-ribosylglycohydrolase family protein [Streptomyces sp. NBC_01439]|nr:ADP-ribosylglycohydrolase family protein [Streptomyces sp. NBC_01439]